MERHYPPAGGSSSSAAGHNAQAAPASPASSSLQMIKPHHHRHWPLKDVQEKILEEMRRANRVAAENQRETNRLLEQTNQIAAQHLAMYRDFFDFMKDKFK